MAPAALILDLDGTIWDSIPWYAQILAGDKFDAAQFDSRLRAGSSVIQLLPDAEMSRNRFFKSCSERLADLALVVARYHFDCVIFYDADHYARSNPVDFPNAIYITSGAREIIFINFLSRSSRATGPKIRVPTGSLLSLMMTAAFSSKRM